MTDLERFLSGEDDVDLSTVRAELRHAIGVGRMAAVGLEGVMRAMEPEEERLRKLDLCCGDWNDAFEQGAACATHRWASMIAHLYLALKREQMR